MQIDNVKIITCLIIRQNVERFRWFNILLIKVNILNILTTLHKFSFKQLYQKYFYNSLESIELLSTISKKTQKHDRNSPVRTVDNQRSQLNHTVNTLL